ncbi:MAG: hypothetical protein ACRDGH_09615 [Candidatus Limnocylindria bacterium]
MFDIEGKIVIKRPVEEVFDFAAEPRYNPHMRRAEQISDGPIGVGTRFGPRSAACAEPCQWLPR